LLALAEDQSCERQERDLRVFAKRAGHQIVAVFKETESGAKNDRAERKKVMVLAQARKIDAILVTCSPSALTGQIELIA
jgi:putative DNA-invertase from lambdoid prophage Rac